MAASAVVRPVEAEETPRIIDFLRRGFVPHLTAAALRGLFDYQWEGAAQKPNRGFALWASNGDVCGFIGAIYARRLLAGQAVMTCNLSTWYVVPEFRAASMKLLYAVLSQKEYSILNFTPSPGVRRIMEGLGFETMDTAKLVYLPWRYPRQMLSRGAALVDDPEAIQLRLPTEERQLLRDHLPYRLRHYLIEDGNDFSYLVLKRRVFPGHAAFGRVPIKKAKLMWYPCMEVLHLHNPALAVKHWGALVCSIIRRERVLGFVLAERFLAENAPPCNRFDHRNYVLTRTKLPTTIDTLYSELAVLPI